MAKKSIQSITSRYLQEFGATLYLLIDQDGTILETNRFTCSLLGRDITGEPYSKVLIDFSNTLLPFDMAREKQGPHLVNVMACSGLPQTFYCMFYNLDQKVLALGSTDFAEQETLRREIIVLNQDLNNLARQLQKNNSELTRLDCLKNQFLGMASHDLRKPLGAVMAYSETLLDELDQALSEEHKKFLTVIMASSEFMRRLIDNFLDVALIESGRFELNLTRTPLAPLIEQALEIVRFAAKKKGIELQIRHDPRVPDLVLDIPKIEQVIVNLVANAIEHSYPDSVVKIETQLKANVGACIFVQDLGTGIPDEELGTLFASYGKGPGRKTAGERSTGLGLVIARKVIEQHSGAISVQSEWGKGSTFMISLPLSMEE